MANPSIVASIVIASDVERVREDVKCVLDESNTQVREVVSGGAVTEAVKQNPPDLVVLDLQVGTMGGIATCFDLRLEASAGRAAHVPVLMLLDRRADVFLARRATAESWLIKPLDPVRLRRAIDETLAGGHYEDESYRPLTVS